ERITRRRRDHGFEPAPRRHADGAAHEFHRRRVARDDLAEIDVSQIAILVDDRVKAVYVAEPAEWKVRMVSWWATPGATTLRPPDQPAMKCGSTRPVAMRKSASTKRRSSLIGVAR